MTILTLEKAALDYHEFPRPGKLAVALTKPTETQHDLSLAYSPGVAEPVREIVKDPENVWRYTNKGNLVAVISDGTAVLGLGNAGPLAAKPVMEGKAVLFKRFADIDVFDIEVQSPTSQDFINTVTHIAPTFGGINLEDIRGPQCFDIEQALIEDLDITVFHDDQHGTAIVIDAGLMKALEIKGKKIETARVVCVGAGAAGLASMRLLMHLGVKRDNLWVLDSQGVIHTKRSDLSTHKFAFARDTDCRTLDDAIVDADVFIGVSGPDVLTGEQVQKMAPKAIVFALSNPDPEISPALVQQLRPDAIMATGRSDYPNQVNNVLCFPYIFRAALDVRARRINVEMMIAAVEAIRALAKEPIPPAILALYGEPNLAFGPDYILPKPMDKRLRSMVPAAVAKAAIDTGVARLPYPY